MKKCGFVWCCYLFDDLFFESQNFTSRLVFEISLGILGRRVFNILGQQKETQHRSLKKVQLGGLILGERRRRRWRWTELGMIWISLLYIIGERFRAPQNLPKSQGRQTKQLGRFFFLPWRQSLNEPDFRRASRPEPSWKIGLKRPMADRTKPFWGCLFLVGKNQVETLTPNGWVSLMLFLCDLVGLFAMTWASVSAFFAAPLGKLQIFASTVWSLVCLNMLKMPRC